METNLPRLHFFAQVDTLLLKQFVLGVRPINSIGACNHLINKLHKCTVPL